MTMSEDLGLDVGQANELKLAARRAGATNADLKALSEGNMFARILPVLRGDASVTIRHTIDCRAKPYTPKGWKIKFHRKRRSLALSPEMIELYWPGKGSEDLAGSTIITKLSYKGNKNILNANVLDFLLEHPELIPDEWKDLKVSFWGTRYNDNGFIRVPCIVYDKEGDCFVWEDKVVNSYWCCKEPIAMLAS